MTALAGLFVLASCDEFRNVGKKLVIVGIDGMDPNLLQTFMGEGLMPHFLALAEEGAFERLGTSNPPQSPVAWSNFITGMNPGGHGVFDFLHRNVDNYHPMSSTQTAPEVSLWNLPFSDAVVPSPFSDQPEAIRQGTPFWEWLEDDGIRADVYRMPAAYPVEPGSTSQLVLTDMGTPDLQGGIDGIYFYYTSRLPEHADKIKVGKHELVNVDDGVVYTRIFGPPVPTEEANLSQCPMNVYLDPREKSALIELEGGDSVTLREGEWSDWCRVYFDLGLIGGTAGGIVHFYLQEVEPVFKLYASPVNIDPSAPTSPISLPDDDAIADIADAIGPFYTQGLAEETKALQEMVLSDSEFIDQCNVVTEERMRMLDYALDRFEDGLLFFYFSTVDLRCHMMWRHIESGHPARDEDLARQHQFAIRDAYLKMDEALGEIRERVGHDTPIMVMSDHGFAPFTRKLNINKFLRDEGYLTLDQTGQEMFDAAGDALPGTIIGIDWSKTKAYAVGFNGIYINQKGREPDGIVDESATQALLEELRTKLLALKDDKRSGAAPVRRVFLRDEIYQGDAAAGSPDLVIGFDAHYGASDDTALGLVPCEGTPLIEDNENYWSGNHLMDPEVVPGILVTNLPVKKKDPTLCDLTATLLHHFDLKIPEEVVGSPVTAP